MAFLNGRQASAHYCTTVQDSLLEFSAINYEENLKFQQDNAPIHVLKASKPWINDHNIETVQSPACSSDLKPIEDLWSLFSKSVHISGRQFDTIDALKQAVNTKCARIDDFVLQNFVLFMRQHCVEVVKSNGGKIN